MAENYHLKWDSHPMYMNLSLSNLFKNEKFADVMLLTSNSDGGPGILAHKIILTSCSSYFSSIFDMNPIATSSGIIYIVLPPELSRRAIKILVQYMYVGEATVSNDILNEVLKGGEILKIRGLCRNKNEKNDNNGGVNYTRSYSTDSNSSHHYSSRKPVDMSEGSKNIDRERSLLLTSVKTSLPKESPVIVRSPKPPLLPLSSATSQNHYPSNLNNNIQSSSSSNISVRKDVAIDPDENNSSLKYFRHQRHSMSSLIKESCTETSCSRNYHSSSSIETPLSPLETGKNQLDNEETCDRCPKSNQDSLDNQHHNQKDVIQDNESSSLRLCSRRSSLSSKQCDRSLTKRTSALARFFNENSTDSERELKLPIIKQEPNECDWPNEELSNSPKTLLPLNIIKTETDDHSGGEDQSTDKENENELPYSPLTCELCSETFTLPKDWVHHIQGHMDSASTHILPKKKRRISPQSESENAIATLKCDLCSTFYKTPAEWVRHIQNSHTETELAMSNVEHSNNISNSTTTSSSSAIPSAQPKKSKSSSSSSSSSSSTTKEKKKYQPNLEYTMYLGKTCAICNKKFPSYASMVIHSRTHSTKL